MGGLQTALSATPSSTLPNRGEANRFWLLPDPAKNSTSPPGSSAACTGSTWEKKLLTCQLP